MNERQAVKFWNAISRGEIVGAVGDTEHVQGFNIEKPTYTSTICDQFDLNELLVPRIQYGYQGDRQGTVNPPKEQAIKVASFLRMVADKIESAASVNLENK